MASTNMQIPQTLQITTPESWNLVERMLASGEHVFLSGPPGAGKTHAAQHLACNDSMHVVNVTFTEDMPSAELRGHYIPKGGEFVWHDGPLVDALRHANGTPIRLVFNELSIINSDCTSFLLSMLDGKDVLRITLPSGDVVTLPEGARVQAVGTANDTIDNVRPALADRFALRAHITCPSAAALASLPESLRLPAQNAVLAGTSGLRPWFTLARLMQGNDMSLADALALLVIPENVRETVQAIELCSAPAGS